MGDWTTMLAAQNWCDQFQCNGGRIGMASEGYMNSPSSSFSWGRTPEGGNLWHERFDFFRRNSNCKHVDLCR